MSHKQIYYSDKYDDEEFEYRHVMLPKDIAKLVPKTHLMSESEWRNLGVQQSQGWVHYMIHEPGRMYPGYVPCFILHQKTSSWTCSK
ncbi:cyclin-dependent kinases regulatory subunit 1 isoform X2 [Nycticebus coucang]|uniref:cyclin-dependent kinases regulatory subunit 1 isoform X2 n=1 Tax=Nycticebus coucang TaxID=9470 RepID=UPI00234C1741|nr:cyclin-dependent kinases regulatory subunit 1 isoform X2 [Nycticebus coucang]